MDIEFDKTIDAILRKARDPSLVGTAATGAHLDADELSMFAENASPTAFRQKQAEHLANCGNCRKVLAQLISLNANKVEPEVSAPTIQVAAVNSVPWYRRLFLFPNIAYVMGSLVVIFGGLLAFSLIQTGKNAEVSQSADKFPQSESAPMAAANRSMAANSAINSNEPESRPLDSIMSNSNASAASNRMVSATPSGKESLGESTSAKDEAQPDAGVGQLQKAKPSERDDRSTVDGASGTQNKYSIERSETEASDKEDRAKLRSMDAPIPAPPPAVSMSRANPEKKAVSNDSKTIGNQRFVRKQGVWYDVRYSDQPTINISRGSSQYKKLDTGLKNIAQKLDGTAVVLWKEKAYRFSD